MKKKDGPLVGVILMVREAPLKQRGSLETVPVVKL
jgi:hypothetical protein